MGSVHVGHCQYSRWPQAKGIGSQCRLPDLPFDSEDARGWNKGKPCGVPKVMRDCLELGGSPPCSRVVGIALVSNHFYPAAKG